MKKDDFKLGENVQLITYSYDDQGNEYSREVKGKICQITNSFIVSYFFYFLSIVFRNVIYS